MQGVAQTAAFAVCGSSCAGASSARPVRTNCGPEIRRSGLPCLSSCEKPFIFFVGADPEPEDLIRRSADAHRAVTAADADRNQPVRPMNLLEVQPRMTRVRNELPLGRTRLTANVGRKRGHQVPKALGEVRIHNWSGSSGVVRPRACSSRASSAIRSRTVPGLSNSSLHRRSDSISASNQAPIAFCSLSGSFEASETAFSRSFSIAVHCTTRPRMRWLTPRALRSMSGL